MPICPVEKYTNKDSADELHSIECSQRIGYNLTESHHRLCLKNIRGYRSIYHVSFIFMSQGRDAGMPGCRDARIPK